MSPFFDPRMFHACNYLKINKLSADFHCSTAKLAFIFHICKHYFDINIISQYINTNSQMRHIEIYPLNFPLVAYLRALCCVFSRLDPRFWFSVIWDDCRA